MKPIARKALQVSGPPCAGKSTRLRELAADGWVVLDDWEFHRQRGATSRDTISDESWRTWYRYLNLALHRRGRPLAYIQGKPDPRYPGVPVEVLNPGEEECHRRATADGRPPTTHEWITAWFLNYGCGA